MPAPASSPSCWSVSSATISRSKDYHGFLQADAYGGYDGIFLGSNGTIEEVACWAHARRKFIEAQTTDLARASVALVFDRELYALEKAIRAEIAKTVPEDESDESARAAIRLRIRQEKAKPVLDRFREWLEAEKSNALPKSRLALDLRRERQGEGGVETTKTLHKARAA